MNAEEIARRFAERPGYALVSYGEVGLPVWKVSIRAEVLEHKPIDAFSEFVLRSVQADVVDLAGIRGLLGLHQRVVEATVVGLLGHDELFYAARPDSSTTALTLTPKGRKSLETAISIVPEEAIIEIDYDGLLRRPVPFVEKWLTPFELRELGAREIPPARVRPPDLEHLDIAAVDAVVRQLGERRHAKRDLLAFKAIERRRRVFQHAVILVYRSESGPEIQVGFAIGGRLSPDHEEAFAHANLARKLGVTTDEPAADEVLPKSLRAAVPPRPSSAARTDPDVSQAVPGAEAATPAELPIAHLATYDHPEYLRRAIHDAKDRLLIISPWIKRAVADDAFIKGLHDRLGEGVDIYIGWGISKLDQPDKDIDAKVLAEFGRLRLRYPFTFRCKRLGTTHSKVLLLDSEFVVLTSFNWLSFKGDPNRTFRDERGFLVSDPATVNSVFDEWEPKFS